MRDAKYLDLAVEAASKRRESVSFASWARGYGVIRHSDSTQVQIANLQRTLESEGTTGDGPGFLELLVALDQLTSAGMWLLVHQTYAKHVYLDGRALRSKDFKSHPMGNTGDSLNLAPAYAGYLAANVLNSTTRGWLLGQGHCVAAVDSLNLLVGNVTAAHAKRYPLTDAGLTTYARDFYACGLGPDGTQGAPQGTHVNASTAGGISGGGYPGLAELQYVHIPLPGERLVVFLSNYGFDGPLAGDCAPRWWRAEDSGLVAPILIDDSGDIEPHAPAVHRDRTAWLVEHMQSNGFDPIVFDGRDPAAFLWAIFEIEQRLQREAQRIESGEARYPIRMPCGIADTPRTLGSHGGGTNVAFQWPIKVNPKHNAEAAAHFNSAASRLWVSTETLGAVRFNFSQHEETGRSRERDNPIANRDVTALRLESPAFVPLGPEPRSNPENWTLCSPMVAVDTNFSAFVSANPDLRPRVGNPGAMRANRLLKTLEQLKFRATDPDRDRPEAIDGAVITARDEQAVTAAALANKGGINLIHACEAFGSKMLGALRHELLFSRDCLEHGRPPGWLSIPVLLTSHTWESGNHGQSHQDPSLSESLLREPYDVSRVLFPPDANSAIATLENVYETRGQIWAVVVPRAVGIPNLFSPREARQLIADGAMALPWASYRPEQAQVILTAVGAYQLGVVLRAARRLADRKLPHSVVYLAEPGRLRVPHTAAEHKLQIDPQLLSTLLPSSVPSRVFVTHTHPEAMLGLLGPLHTGNKTVALGYTNCGGTLSTASMLFANGTSWAHSVSAVARLLEIPEAALLEDAERNALHGKASPHGPVIPRISH